MAVDIEILQDVIAHYKNYLPNYFEGEQYKWEAIKRFQDVWDINAENFEEMFTQATDKANNLLGSMSTYPRGMMIAFIEADSEAVRNMFINLYDEGITLSERVQNFIDESERLRITYGKDIWKNHFQNTNSISVYLWMRYPDKYYIYKPTICKNAGEILKSNDIPKHDGSIDSMLAGFEIFNDICDNIKQSDELRKLCSQVVGEACYPDPELHTFAMDVAFYIKHFYEADKRLANGSEYWSFAAGKNSNFWDEFYDNGIMAIGWDYLGNLNDYTSDDEISAAINNDYADGKNHFNDIRGVLDFWKGMKIGDIVYVKKGKSKIIGKGVIESDYYFDESRERYKHVRKVRWIEKGSWSIGSGELSVKTLTKITLYDYLIKKIELKINPEEEFDNHVDEVGVNISEAYVCENIASVVAPYTKTDFLNEVYMSESKYDQLYGLLLRKKNIILQGAPGVGKTFAAKRLAFSIMGQKDNNRVEFVQFHQNYTYEDFVMGFKPTETGFVLRKGIFYRFCKKAETDPNNKYFFIIDEINRGNLSKIFGELLMLIERDYRKESISLAYSQNGEKFTVPENLYIIGMMNTADRSLAMIDYALRRRFSFVDIEPGFDSKGFRAYMNNTNSNLFTKIISEVYNLNEEIKNDPSLGKGFCIGHSYFCNHDCEDDEVDNIYDNDKEWLSSIISYDILPMLNEYWFDDNSKITKWRNVFSKILEGGSDD